MLLETSAPQSALTAQKSLKIRESNERNMANNAQSLYGMFRGCDPNLNQRKICSPLSIKSNNSN